MKNKKSSPQSPPPPPPAPWRLRCDECGFVWECHSPDVGECPACESRDIVVVKKDSMERQ